MTMAYYEPHVFKDDEGNQYLVSLYPVYDEEGHITSVDVDLALKPAPDPADFFAIKTWGPPLQEVTDGE